MIYINQQPPEAERMYLSPVEKYVATCLEKTAEKAIGLAGANSGYIYFPDEINNNPRSYLGISPDAPLKNPYWFYDGIVSIPSQEFIESQISRYIKENMKFCVNDFEAFKQQYDINQKGSIEETTKMQDMSIEQRLELIHDLLKDEGFEIEWERKEDQYFIREINCPYLYVSQSHPEVCSIDQTLISTMLDLPTEKVKCILDGDNHCTYVVPDIRELIPSEEYS